MNQQQALAVQCEAQADPRILAQVLKAGGGFRIRLVLRPGTRRQRVTTIRFAKDLELILALWEGR
jgi:hypothetical protein